MTMSDNYTNAIFFFLINKIRIWYYHINTWQAFSCKCNSTVYNYPFMVIGFTSHINSYLLQFHQIHLMGKKEFRYLTSLKIFYLLLLSLPIQVMLFIYNSFHNLFFLNILEYPPVKTIKYFFCLFYNFSIIPLIKQEYPMYTPELIADLVFFPITFF